LLNEGEKVVATARKVSTLDSFKGATDSNFLPLPLDITDETQVARAFEQAISKFGRLDVVVNNAGYTLAGPFETLSESQIRDQFETNVFGTLHVTRHALQVLRSQSPPGGLIQQIGTIGGQVSYGGVGIYNGTKWAVEGITEALSQEMNPAWNIRFTIIEPGMFRTPGPTQAIKFGDLPSTDYGHLDVKAILAGFLNSDLVGNPAKGARAMYQLACMPDPPLRAALGDMAHNLMQKKIEDYRELYNRPEVVEIVTNLGED
jgi:NAD(P)-dependent dehydrogenase (short-subunit alcohol dehydrogenase family)